MTPSRGNPEERKGFYTSGSGLASWLTTTDHKRIGILYLISMFTLFLVAVSLGFIMRLEMLTPDKTVVTADTYNALFTMHGIIMIFLFIIPGIPAALGNFALPLQLGAPDVAFPRLNLASWYFYIAGALIAISTVFIGGGPPDTGWTFYAPYSLTTQTNVTLALLAAFTLGFSSILTGLNFITTIHRFRAKGMGWGRITLFSWALYTTGWIQILATPILGITLFLLMAERILGVGFFDPTKGGDPILFEHLFWIYSHPAVYVMILPGMGVISEIFPAFARRNVFGYKAVAASSIAIAGVGYLVWGHHMFTSGMSDTARWLFSLITFIVAIPSGIKVFNWISTLYKGSIHMDTPLMYALSFIFLFSIGGLTGLVLGALSTNVHVHDTYFVVGHFHYVMFGGTVIAFFAGIHYWYPKMFGRMYGEVNAKIACLLLFIGINFLYFPMLIMGYLGMPRRYYNYLPQYKTWHIISTVGSWVVVAGLLFMLGNLLWSLRRGSVAPDNPWQATTLEWQTTSPPPPENFATPPVVDRGPYSRKPENQGG